MRMTPFIKLVVDSINAELAHRLMRLRHEEFKINRFRAWAKETRQAYCVSNEDPLVCATQSELAWNEACDKICGWLGVPVKEHA
jgi:hypothetical protein